MLGSASIVFFAYSTVTTSILQGIDKLKVPVINSAISLGIHIIMLTLILQFTELSTYALVIGNVTFPLVVSILNWHALEKYINYRQEVIKTFAIPCASALIMGLLAHFLYKGLHALTGSMMFATSITILLAIIIYFVLLVLFKGVNEDEIRQLPKGHVLVRILKSLHLLGG